MMKILIVRYSRNLDRDSNELSEPRDPPVMTSRESPYWRRYPHVANCVTVRCVFVESLVVDFVWKCPDLGLVSWDACSRRAIVTNADGSDVANLANCAHLSTSVPTTAGPFSMIWIETGTSASVSMISPADSASSWPHRRPKVRTNVADASTHSNSWRTGSAKIEFVVRWPTGDDSEQEFH